MDSALALAPGVRAGGPSATDPKSDARRLAALGDTPSCVGPEEVAGASASWGPSWFQGSRDAFAPAVGAFLPVVSFLEVVPHDTVLVASLAEEEVPSSLAHGLQAVRAEPLRAEHRGAGRAHRPLDVPRHDPG